MEDGNGVSGMNLEVEVVDVEEGYPKQADDEDNEEEEEANAFVAQIQEDFDKTIS